MMVMGSGDYGKSMNSILNTRKLLFISKVRKIACHHPDTWSCWLVVSYLTTSPYMQKRLNWLQCIPCLNCFPFQFRGQGYGFDCK